jgi:hypothetical protein
MLDAFAILNAHARHDILLVDVEPGTPGMHYFHRLSPHSRSEPAWSKS